MALELIDRVDTATMAGAGPVDPEDVRRAMVGLIAAHWKRHYRPPSRTAVLDIWRMLTADPRSELSAEELRKEHTRAYRERVRAG